MLTTKEVVAKISLGVCAALLVCTAASIAMAFQLGLYGTAVFGFFIGGLNIINIHLAKDIIKQAEEERNKKNESLKKVG